MTWVAMRKNGFTLIEVIIAVAIIGVLAGVAVPMYNQYIIKSRMTAVLNYGAGLKAEAHEYFLRNGRFPHSDGYANRTLVNDDNVHAYEYWAPSGRTSILVHIYLQPDVYPGATRQIALLLKGEYTDGDIEWSCRQHTGFRKIPDRYNLDQCSEGM